MKHQPASMHGQPAPACACKTGRLALGADVWHQHIPGASVDRKAGIVPLRPGKTRRKRAA